jgi:hypothetical protein
MELVDAVSGTVIMPLRSWIMPGISGQSQSVPYPCWNGWNNNQTLPNPNPPTVYLRIRSMPNGPSAPSVGLQVIGTDSAYSSLLGFNGFGKLPVPRRLWALPVIEDLQPFPNPSIGQNSLLRFTVYDPGFVTVSISDLIGRYRKTVVSEAKTPGRYWAQFATSGLDQGAYLVEQRLNGMLLGRGMVMVVK